MRVSNFTHEKLKPTSSEKDGKVFQFEMRRFVFLGQRQQTQQLENMVRILEGKLLFSSFVKGNNLFRHTHTSVGPT